MLRKVKTAKAPKFKTSGTLKLKTSGGKHFKVSRNLKKNSGKKGKI